MLTKNREVGIHLRISPVGLQPLWHYLTGTNLLPEYCHALHFIRNYLKWQS